MDYTKVTTEIGEIVRWYGKVKHPTPDELMNAYKRLTGFLWFYAEYVADVKGEWNQKYFMRRIETEREKMNLIKQGLAVNKSEIEAMLSTETQFMAEMEAESMAYRADLLLKQGNRVSDCLRSHLSLLKKEVEQTQNN